MSHPCRGAALIVVALLIFRSGKSALHQIGFAPTRTPDEIERDIVTERAEMSDTFRDLQEKFSVETILNDVGDMVRDQGGELGRRVSQKVGRNAIARVGL